MQAFIAAHPAIAQAAPSVDSGFPRWLRVQHFLDMLFMMFIIRAGIQIFEKVLNRQAARSVHFISFFWFVLFIIAHGIMVFVTSLRANTNHMFAGVDSPSWVGFWPFVLAMTLVGLAW